MACVSCAPSSPSASGLSGRGARSNRQLRVLLLSEFYPPARGGLEFHVAGVAEGLVARGHQVEVATLGPERSVEIERGVTVHRLRSTASRLRFLYEDPSRPFHLPVPDPAVWRQLHAVTAAFCPDVVHAHNWMAASLPRTGAPLILTSHDYAWICPKRTMLLQDGSTCSGPRLSKCTLCSRMQYGSFKAPLLDASTRFGRRWVRPQAHVAVSTAVAQRLKAFSRHVRVVPNFVPADLQDMPEVDVNGLPAPPFALFAGSVQPHKGTAVLASAWRSGPPPCSLVVAALDSAKEPWPEATTVLNLSRQEVLSVMRRSTVLVVPSLWPEPCPTVVLEAMALGVPVVASSVGGIPEILGRAGRTVPPGDALALRRAVKDILDDRDLAAQMSEAGRSRSQSYAMASVLSELERIYQEVVSAANGTD